VPREMPDGSPAGDAGGAPAPGRPALPGPGTITVTLWHNVAFDGQGRHTAMLDGYQPGDSVVRVFAYQTDSGRPAEEVAEEAFGFVRVITRTERGVRHLQRLSPEPRGEELARRYYRHRLLRSLSFPQSERVAPSRGASRAVSRCRVARVTMESREPRNPQVEWFCPEQ
jgi:hypothetical protein